jgi:hypothetical protein
MEKRFTYLLGLSKHTENYLMHNELKELKKDILKFPMLRVEAMERRIKELEQDNELLTAKLQALKNYYGQD